MKNTNLILIYLLLTFTLNIHSQIAPGEIAFIGYNTDNPDGFAFITLKEIPQNEIIYFTDSGWNNSTEKWSSNEAHFSWKNNESNTPIGSIIYIYESSENVLTVDGLGIASSLLIGSSWSLISGDQIFAYQGEKPKDPNPKFITGIQGNYESDCIDTLTGWEDSTCMGTANAKSSLPNALKNGDNAIALFNSTEKDNAIYTGSLNGNVNEIRKSINNASNWIANDDLSEDIKPLTSNFSSNISSESNLSITKNTKENFKIFKETNTLIINSTQDAIVSIYNITGHKLRELKIEDGNNKIKHDFPDGLYIIKFHTEQISTTQKIIL